MAEPVSGPVESEPRFAAAGTLDGTPRGRGIRYVGGPPPGPLSIALKILGCFVGVAAILGVGALIAFLARSNLLTLPWLIGGGIIIGALAVSLCLLLWRTRLPAQKLRYGLLLPATSLLLAVSLFGVNLTSQLIANFDEGFGPDPETAVNTVRYEILAPVYQQGWLPALSGRKVGVLESDPNRSLVDTKLSEQVQTTIETYDDPAVLAGVLRQGGVGAAVVSDSFRQLFQQYDPTFSERVKVIGSFEVVPVKEEAAEPAYVPPTPPDQPFLVYISGIDEWGEVENIGRSDTNILMAVNPKTGQVLLVNTPRDYYVPLRDHDGYDDKLTHSGIYGIEVSQGTMEDLYGLEVDYYVRINFWSFMQIIDVMGGIDVVNPQEFGPTAYLFLTFPEGRLHLSGAEALAFARERKSFEDGDRVRGENQERVVDAMIQKMRDPRMLLKFGDLFDAVQHAVDTDIPTDKMKELVRYQLTSGRVWTTESMSVTGYDASRPTYSMGSTELYVMIPDDDSVEEAQTALKAVLERD